MLKLVKVVLNEMPYMYAAKYYIICLFHDVRPVFQQHRKQLGQS